MEKVTLSVGFTKKKDKFYPRFYLNGSGELSLKKVISLGKERSVRFKLIDQARRDNFEPVKKKIRQLIKR